MTGSLRRTLEELVRSEANLPNLCNVLVRISSAPVLVRGEKWVFKVEGLSGTSEARVAIHERLPAGLALGYDRTAPELLKVFQDETLRSLLTPGETLLLQAVPRRGNDGLWLNVASVLIARPHRTFGRVQIDFASTCPRRSYLSVVKGVRGNRRNQLTWGSVAGQLVHDLFSHWATGHGSIADEESTSPFASDTILDLLSLGISSREELSRALKAGEDLRRLLRANITLQGILAQGPWESESHALNNGVAASPDLMKEGSLIELKNIAKGSPNDHEKKHLDQIRAYLAWAMIEYGVPVVSDTWQALLVRLHPNWPDNERIVLVKATPDMVGSRILQRHRLLTLHAGHWLPSPGPECNYCEFGDRRDVDEPGAPPPCEYYCQTERSWACEEEGKACPLLNRCDQRHRWFDFEELDRTNRQRMILSAEEEEREVISSLLDALIGGEGGEQSGLTFADFKVQEYVPGLIKLSVPAWAQNFEWALVGDSFRMTREGQEIGMLVFERRRGQSLIFRVIQCSVQNMGPGQEITLRVIPHWDTEPRDLLSFLDMAQRSPSGAGSGLRPKSSSASLRVVDTHGQDPLTEDADLTLVDVQGFTSLRKEINQILDIAQQLGITRIAVAGMEDLGGVPADSAMRFDPVSIDESLSGSSLPLVSRFEEVAAKAKAARVWYVPRKELHGIRLTSVVESLGRFPLLIVAGAEKLPLLLLARCFALAERVVLVGQSLASGPTAEEQTARHSEVFQNTLGYLLAGATEALPARVTRIQVVRRDPQQALVGMRVLGYPESGRSVPLELVDVPTQSEPEFRGMEQLLLQASINSSTGMVKEVVAQVPLGESVSATSIRSLLRGIPVGRLETLENKMEGSMNNSLLGHRIKLDSIRNHIKSTEHPTHLVKVSLPVLGFRFVQERCNARLSEVQGVLDYLRENRHGDFVITSPFFAQCRQLAAACASGGITNAKVIPLDRLGRKDLGNTKRNLLVSWVAGAAGAFYPAPLDDPSRLIEIFYGDWEKVVIFSSEAARKHHPVLRALTCPDQADQC